MKIEDLVLQIDPGLPPVIHAGGCHFRSLLAAAEVRRGAALSVSAILDAYHYARSTQGVMTDDCTMGPNLAMVTNWALYKLGDTGRCHQIGIAYPEARFEFWPSVGAFTILKGLLKERSDVTGRPVFHFRLGDRMGKLVFDPDPGLNILSEDSVLIYTIT